MDKFILPNWERACAVSEQQESKVSQAIEMLEEPIFWALLVSFLALILIIAVLIMWMYERIFFPFV